MGKPTQASTKLIDSFLAAGLDEIHVQEFIRDFDFWKSFPAEVETDVFARDGANRGSSYLRHVHIVPLNDKEALARWNRNYENGDGNRSDRYLFYVNGGAAFGYMLLAVINDPGAHNIWAPENKDLLAEFERLAEDFYYNGVVP